jgi:UDP-N-acetylglucosamine--N-acetylmuramyl-(pentapeptide) pyrophosphoryl-undecaprenol N-acetylglucosamine transferase
VSTLNDIRVLIVAGGTGGHISPGLALYESFREAGVRTLFLSGRRDERFSSLDDVGAESLHFYRPPSFSRNPIKLALFPAGFATAMLYARALIRKNSVKAIIGMGGYVSAPALLTAALMKVPLFLCEQNSVPGKVTKFFEKHAKKIYGTFRGAAEFMKLREKYVLAGNPIRKKVLADAYKEDARKAFHLGHCKKVILVIGGSQGAVRINELIYHIKKDYSDELKNVGVIWSTGDFSYEKYKEKINNEIDAGSIYVSPFIDKVGLAYRAADIAISRSGAGVMMELAAMGVPSIQIPYPHAADNHQDGNADEFVQAGAAVKISDEDAVPEKVMPVLHDLMNNPRALQRMSERALGAAMVDAADTIVKDIMKEIGTVERPVLKTPPSP